jgi:hypothetical protein
LGSAENPVRCDGKRGEIAYLMRLRCPSGGPPHFHFQRRGPRGPHGNESDEFELRCVLDDRSYRVFLDRHHPDFVAHEPPSGFRLEQTAPATPPAGVEPDR